MTFYICKVILRASGPWIKDVKWVRKSYTVFVSLVSDLRIVSKGKGVIFGERAKLQLVWLGKLSVGFKSMYFNQKGPCCSTWAASVFLPLLSWCLRDFPGRQCPVWMLVIVTLQALRRVSDDVGDIDVISWDLGEGSKVKLLGLIGNHIRSGCPWAKGNLTLT